MLRPILLAMAMTLGGAAQAADGGGGSNGPGPGPQVDYLITVRNEALATVRVNFLWSTLQRELLAGQSAEIGFRDALDSSVGYWVEAFMGYGWEEICNGRFGNVLRWDGDRRVAAMKVRGDLFTMRWSCNPE